MDNLFKGPDGRNRCGWCAGNPLYIDYHDSEWGCLTLDNRRHFEFIVLESAQAGLSWLTVLKKREAYRKAYMEFDPEQVSRWGEKQINALLANPGIIRNRAKIGASIGNARVFLELTDRYGSFGRWLLDFYSGKPLKNRLTGLSDIPAATAESEAVSRELKRLGFKFFGPVIAYSHMQATGIVDDHLEGCWRRTEQI